MAARAPSEANQRGMCAVLVLVALTSLGCMPRLLQRPASPALDRTITRMWVAEMRPRLRHGDWILARSYSGIGDVISVLTGGVDLSHSVMWDAERGVAIESIVPVTREISLESMVDRNHYLYIVRPAYRDDADRAIAVARARSMLGSRYDRLGLLGFRSAEGTYCSLLMFWASDMASRHSEDPLVVAPSDLLELGEIVYFTGVRTSDDTVAMASDFAEAAGRDLGLRLGPSRAATSPELPRTAPDALTRRAWAADLDLAPSCGLLGSRCELPDRKSRGHGR